MDKIASAHDLPKFVKVDAAAAHELRKVGTSSRRPPNIRDAFNRLELPAKAGTRHLIAMNLYG